jgi:hypothetical protein
MLILKVLQGCRVTDIGGPDFARVGCLASKQGAQYGLCKPPEGWNLLAML